MVSVCIGETHVILKIGYMKKLFSILVALGSLLAISCDPDNNGGTTTEATLSVDLSSLSFVAVEAPAQTVTVTASGVEWDFKVPETVAVWLKVEKTDANTLTVTVTDNTKPEKRTGSFTVYAVDNEDVKAKTITVSQEASSVEYKLTVNPSALTFEAENAALQTVEVTTEGQGLKWTAAAEGDAASWITLTPKEEILEVSVTDNPDTKERVGNIIVTASEESAGKRVIRVTQKELVLPPSLSIDVDPETGLVFHRNGHPKEGGESSIKVTAVNVDWDAKAVDENNKDIEWFTLWVNKGEDYASVSIDMQPNKEYRERIGYIVITSDNEDVPGFKVKITQEAAEEYFSTLTNDVDVSDIVNAQGYVYPNQEWEDAVVASGWTIRFWTDGVNHDIDLYTTTGTGGYMEIEFAAEHMVFNDDEAYSLTEGVYTIAPSENDGQRLPPMSVTQGTPGFYDYQQFGSWYMKYENDEKSERGPLSEGTITVSKEGGERYKFVFDCVDDLGYTITGSFTVELPYIQQGMPVGPPPVTNPIPGSLR